VQNTTAVLRVRPGSAPAAGRPLFRPGRVPLRCRARLLMRVGSLLPLALSCCATAQFAPAEEDLAGFTGSQLPLVLEAGGLARVEVCVNGEPLSLMLDTADYACFSLNTGIVDGLGLKVTGAERHADVTGRRFRVRTIVARELRLGSLVLHDVPGRENLAGPDRFDGTLGSGLLARFGVLLDYGRRRMALYPRGELPPFLGEEAWHRVRLTDRADRLLVTFEGVEGEYSMGFDTGCSDVFVSSDSELGRAMLSSLETTRMAGEINGVPTQDIHLCRVDRIMLGDYDAGGSDCVIGAAARFIGNGLLGGGFLKDNRVFLDREKQEMWLSRSVPP
jgi:hypothetical protein